MLTNQESRTLALVERLERPPVQWDVMNDEMDAAFREGLIRDLEAMACRAAMLTGYLERRYGSGCGDQGHQAAVKEANRRLVAVRKAMGFSYPKSGCVSF